MKKENNPVSQEKFKTLIGGQALIEGIMMQGPDKRSIVVRGPEGLVTKVEPLKKRTGIAKWPLIRGVVNFASSMVSGVKALMYSAEFFPEEEDAQPSKFDQWLEKKLGSEKMEKAVHFTGRDLLPECFFEQFCDFFCGKIQHLRQFYQNRRCLKHFHHLFPSDPLHISCGDLAHRASRSCPFGILCTEIIVILFSASPRIGRHHCAIAVSAAPVTLQSRSFVAPSPSAAIIRHRVLVTAAKA